ncbi:hypothetical protein [Actinomadura sp. SCN-SB]|uniref:hypothetical protein n=1 Tax=Actinomadura sp. SCN-SB TaxID=3373092 RepID=UPI003752FA97
MNGHDDVPEWLPDPPRGQDPPPEPRPPRGYGGFMGASDAGGAVPRFRSSENPPGNPPEGGGPSRPPLGEAGPSGHRLASPTVPSRPGATGPGRHVAPGRSLPRGTAFWGPMAGAAVLTLLAGLGVYALASGGPCTGADALQLNLAAAPEIAPAVTKAAGRFNDDRNEVGDRCVRVSVRAADPVAVSTLLSGRGVAGVTEKPDVWIPDSSLWTVLARAPSTASGGRQGTGTITTLRSIASTPVVVATPAGVARRLQGRGGARPSWQALLVAAGAGAGTGPGTGSAIPPGSVKLRVPDPNRTATGMAALMLANILLGRQDEGSAQFTGAVRTLREAVTPSVQAEFASFRQDRQGRHPIALAPEQAVYAYNGGGPEEQAVAVYPSEGTLAMDYRITVVGRAGDRDAAAKAAAARLLEKELTGDDTRDDLMERGFRAPSGAAPESFGDRAGLDPRPPRLLSPPSPADVQRIMQSWARLSLGIRMLSVIDISGSMNEEVEPGVTRLQSTVRAAQAGLSLLPDDSELGQWVFSTELVGEQDWRELVSVGPLGERLGSSTRRQLILSAFSQIRAKRNGGTGLYDTTLAAFDYMQRTYKPEFVHSVLLWTDGRNLDREGASLKETLDTLRRSYDPARPVQVFMFGYGKDVDVDELRRITQATRGDVVVAQTPGEVRKLFLQSLSRRICAPSC